jgi:hypothetical protein
VRSVVHKDATFQKVREFDAMAGMWRGRPELSPTIIRRVLVTIGYLAITAQVLLVASRPTHYQWDFRAYYYGAYLALAGADPYNLDHLGKAMAEDGLMDGHVVPFIYPPHALLEFAPLTLVSFTAAFYIYLAVKIIALIVVLAVGASWLDGWWRSSWPLLASIMFSGALGGDLRSGNVGMVEAALVLLAIVALTRKRFGVFGGLITAASSWKLVLIPIDVLAVASRSRSALRGVIPPALVIGTLVLLDRLLRPDLWNNFRETSAGLVQDIQGGSLRGNLNASLLRLLADVSDLAFGRIQPVQVISAYVAISLMVITITIVAIARRPNVTILPICMYALLAYGLIVPRLAPYSLVLLLAPVVYVLNKCMRLWGAAAIAGFACVPFFYVGRLFGRPDNVPPTSFFILPLEYANFVIIAICWIVMTDAFIHKRARFEDATNSAGHSDVQQRQARI